MVKIKMSQEELKQIVLHEPERAHRLCKELWYAEGDDMSVPNLFERWIRCEYFVLRHYCCPCLLGPPPAQRRWPPVTDEEVDNILAGMRQTYEEEEHEHEHVREHELGPMLGG